MGDRKNSDERSTISLTFARTAAGSHNQLRDGFSPLGLPAEFLNGNHMGDFSQNSRLGNWAVDSIQGES
jgi:hypothetical protein